MKFKIILSIFFLFGFFFFRIIGPIITKRLKDFHLEHNPKLVEKAPGIFKFFNYFFNAASIMALIYIVMIWSGFVTIPNE